jgi:hypothetical protein
MGGQGAKSLAVNRTKKWNKKYTIEDISVK